MYARAHDLAISASGIAVAPALDLIIGVVLLLGRPTREDRAA